MSSDLFNTPEHEIFRETVRKFAEEELAPRAREFDAAGRIDKSLVKRMGDLGMLGLRFDPEWGGAGLDWSFTTVLFEEMVRCDNAGVTMGISVQTDMATPSLHEFGSDDLKAQYLAPAIAGEMVAAIAVTEPDAGSDVAGIKTRAVRDGDDWVINGSKIYITNAATADWLCLLAVTDPDAGYGGFSQIIVPTDVPGCRCDLLDKIGNWGSDTGQLFFEDVRVPVANTIGDIGRGFQQQMMQFQDERLVACVSTVAGSNRLWERTKQYSEERVLRQAAQQDAGDPVQVRGDAHPDRGRARARLRLRAQARRRRGRHEGDHHGEDLLRPGLAHGGRRVHSAPRWLRLHEGVRRRPRLRRQPPRQHRRRLRRDDDPLPRQDARFLMECKA
jgi:alkylation response protein AidB-like acyl-CoA dehydrogenase